MSRAIFAAAIVATAAGLASANTINGDYQSAFGRTISTAAGQFTVGALTHQWTNGTGEAAGLNGTYGTFCIDNRIVNNNRIPFVLRRITEAPVTGAGNFGNPNANYTAMQEKRLAAVVKALQNLNYMDSKGAFNPSGIGGNNDNKKDWSAAMQLIVWESLWESTGGAGWDITAGTFFANAGANPASPSVQAKFGAIAAAATTLFNNNDIQRGLRALTGSTGSGNNERGQDQLIVIPLPPAAWAGLASLAGVVGIGYIRRRKLQA